MCRSPGHMISAKTASTLKCIRAVTPRCVWGAQPRARHHRRRALNLTMVLTCFTQSDELVNFWTASQWMNCSAFSGCLRRMLQIVCPHFGNSQQSLVNRTNPRIVLEVCGKFGKCSATSWRYYRDRNVCTWNVDVFRGSDELLTVKVGANIGWFRIWWHIEWDVYG